MVYLLASGLSLQTGVVSKSTCLVAGGSNAAQVVSVQRHDNEAPAARF